MPHLPATEAPELRAMLAGLIATPSVSSISPEWNQSNLPLLEMLAGWLADGGFRVEILPIPGHADKANLVATLGSGPGGLVLSGHADTVPFDAPLWRHDPLKLSEDGGRLYGLGTADMKSFLGLAIEAARGLSSADLKQPLIILATADEESAMHGARALVDAGRPLGRYAVIGEPTGLRPVRMHKGVMGEAVRLIGKSGHASDPRLGNNALEGMHEVLTSVLAWRDELQRTHNNPAFPVSFPTINPGHIHGGDNPNRICGQCELQLGGGAAVRQHPAGRDAGRLGHRARRRGADRPCRRGGQLRHRGAVLQPAGHGDRRARPRRHRPGASTGRVPCHRPYRADAATAANADQALLHRGVDDPRGQSLDTERSHASWRLYRHLTASSPCRCPRSTLDDGETGGTRGGLESVHPATNFSVKPTDQTDEREASRCSILRLPQVD
jgi:acetylornithine deacetylase